MKKSEQAALGDFVNAEKETQLTAYKALVDRHTRIRDEQALTHAKFQRILEEDHAMVPPLSLSLSLSHSLVLPHSLLF
jgi:hypothetical protein